MSERILLTISESEWRTYAASMTPESAAAHADLFSTKALRLCCEHQKSPQRMGLLIDIEHFNEVAKIFREAGQ
jgi:hypothetical protein